MNKCPLCKGMLHYGELDGERVLICVIHGKQMTLEAKAIIKQDVEKVWKSAQSTPVYKNEKQFQAAVEQCARALGWMVYHTYDSRRCEKGYPDLTMVRDRVLFAELKMPKGKVTPDQEAWIRSLDAARQEVYVWRPDDWEKIERILAL